MFCGGQIGEFSLVEASSYLGLSTFILPVESSRKESDPGFFVLSTLSPHFIFWLPGSLMRLVIPHFFLLTIYKVPGSVVCSTAVS